MREANKSKNLAKPVTHKRGMPIKIRCPICGTEMTVSDAALGTTVGCPWCRHRFRPDSLVSQIKDLKTDKSEPALATPPGVTTIPTKKGVGAELASEEKRTPDGAERRGGDVQPGPAAREAPRAKRTAAEPPEAAQSEPGRQAPLVKPAAGRSPAAAVPGEAPAPSRRAPPAPPQAPKKVARLILTQPAESTWQLAPDGSLPSLRLEEDTASEKERESKRSTNPVLLSLVLACSLLTSLALLFVEMEPVTRSAAEHRERARQELAAEYYSNLNPNAPLAEYQRLLREAHWAHSRGEHQRERQLYQQVLRLLYAERARNTYTGLTGSQSRDRRLEELLHILLKE